MINNGVVRISCRYREGARERNSTAHVHNYATGLVNNELRCAEISSSHCQLLVGAESITLEHIDGPDKGRRHVFTPVSGDEVGWSEMLAFAQALRTP